MSTDWYPQEVTYSISQLREGKHLEKIVAKYKGNRNVTIQWLDDSTISIHYKTQNSKPPYSDVEAFALGLCARLDTFNMRANHMTFDYRKV